MSKLLHDQRLIELWRSQYNPLRGLVMSRVVAILEAAERGEYAELQWLLRTVEKSFPAYLAGKLRRRTALEKLDWNIKVIPEEELPKGVTKAMADAQHDALRELYEQIDNLKQAISELELANFRGYTHLEKWLVKDSEPWRGITRLNPVPQWHWVRDGIYGEWQYNRDATFGTVRGEPIKPERFVMREVEDYFYRIALILFVRHSTAQKDWDGFLEVFGIPAVFIVLPELSNAEDLQKFLETVEKVASDTRGALPFGSTVSTVEPKGQGVEIFEKHSRYQEEQLVLVMTGGKLTMLAESGSGTLAGGAHQDAWDDIMQGEAGRISEIFQQQIDKPFLAAAFPGQPICAWFEIAANEDNDVNEIVEQVAKLKAAGYRVDPGQVAEKTGYELEVVEPVEAQPEAKDPKAPPVKEPLLNTEPMLPMEASEAKALLFGILSETLDAKFTYMLSELLESDMSAAALAKFRDAIPDILQGILQDSSSSNLLTAAFGRLMADGIVMGAVEGQNATLRDGPVNAPESPTRQL